jgi:polysaccharide biosynthesis/export protein
MHKKTLAVFLVWIALGLLANTAVAQVQPAEPAETPLAENQVIIDDDFVIGLEDVLSINIWKNPEISLKEVVVRPDGKISVPLAGEIKADGLTVRKLQDMITANLKEYVNTPVVTVTVIKILSKSVTITGQVPRPGLYPIGSPLTIIELLARAGGLKADASPNKIKIVRKDKGKTSTIPFNYNDMINGSNLKQNIELKSGDIVLVP